MTADHPRISTKEVCELARYSQGTLWRRIDAGDMPAPLDRGGRGYLFDRKAVLRALGLEITAPPEPVEPAWDFDPVAYAEAIARRNRRNKGAAWRDRLADAKAGAVIAPITPTRPPDDPPRMTTKEVCDLARFSSATLWRRIAEGHMPAPIDRGGLGFLFDRQAVIRALGLERVPAAELLTVARNTNDGQNLSDFVRARRQWVADNLPPPISTREALELAKAQIAAMKKEQARKGGAGRKRRLRGRQAPASTARRGNQNIQAANSFKTRGALASVLGDMFPVEEIELVRSDASKKTMKNRLMSLRSIISFIQ